MIGSSDGKQYETPLDLELGRPIPPPEKPASASKSSGGTKVAPHEELHVDRSHDVPLAASALHKDGEFYGIAIDKDAPITPQYDQYIHKHESDEFHYMKDLITNGMHPTEAYHKAHDHITPMESARVQADLGEKGLENYKQYWRDVAKVAGEKEDPNRHPDAHTTTYNLDDAELGKKFKPPVREAVFRGIKGAAQAYRTATDVSPMQPINPMTSTYTQPHAGDRSGPMPWYRGAEGKLRQEVPDNKSKLTVDKAYQALKDNKMVTLGDVLHHPELYESYPDIKDIKVFHDSKMHVDSAYYDHDANKIVVGPHSSEASLRSTILHETQHAIQDREGFAEGSSPAALGPAAQKALETIGIKNPMDKSKFTLDEWNSYLKSLKELSFDSYKHVGGEVEARNVEKRRDWPDEALRIFSPEFTQDYPYEKQLNAPKEDSSKVQASQGKYSPEQLAKIRLDQLLRDKAATKKSGYDVESSDYMHYNTQIRSLREFLKNKD